MTEHVIAAFLSFAAIAISVSWFLLTTLIARDRLKDACFIALATLLGAVCYGVIHDQITIRVCSEYFTAAGQHPYIGDLPVTALAIFWGAMAAWFPGLMLGTALALAATSGQRPARNLRSLVLPILAVLLCMALSALASGFAGYSLAKAGLLHADGLTAEKSNAFMADAFAHAASYLTATIGGLILLYRTWASRD
jgi:hypothetical protein